MTKLSKIISIILIFSLILLINYSCVKAVDLNLTENATSNSNTNSSNTVDDYTDTDDTETSSTEDTYRNSTIKYFYNCYWHSYNFISNCHFD